MTPLLIMLGLLFLVVLVTAAAPEILIRFVYWLEKRRGK